MNGTIEKTVSRTNPRARRCARSNRISKKPTGAYRLFICSQINSIVTFISPVVVLLRPVKAHLSFHANVRVANQRVVIHAHSCTEASGVILGLSVLLKDASTRSAQGSVIRPTTVLPPELQPPPQICHLGLKWWFVTLSALSKTNKPKSTPGTDTWKSAVSSC